LDIFVPDFYQQMNDKVKKNRKLILVTNDDGIEAKGLRELINVVIKFGEVVVVAPRESQSGMSHAITVKYPIRVFLIREEKNLKVYSCNGTPVDCVKIALNQLLNRKPDLLVSGINHGANTSVSVVYSGTMAAAIEGGINKINSIGLSLSDFSKNADFTAAKIYSGRIIEQVFMNTLDKVTCLNVNIPAGNLNNIKGVKICRQTDGHWQEEYDKRTDPQNREYYWLTGYFNNFEPDAEDTDEWAIKNRYVSVVPIQVDFTSVNHLDRLKKWNL
jgi:5'-nucleotidase